jgi:hypothetical protein
LRLRWLGCIVRYYGQVIRASSVVSQAFQRYRECLVCDVRRKSRQKTPKFLVVIGKRLGRHAIQGSANTLTAEP